MRRACSSTRLGPALCLAVVLVQAGVAQAQEAGESHLNIGDLGQAVAAVLIFLGLLAVLGRWAWKPLVAQLRHREESIIHAMEQSQKTQQAAQEMLEAYNARMVAVEAEAAEVLAKSRRDAAAARQEMLAQARQETQGLIASAKEELQHAKQAALHDLYGYAAQLSTQVAAQLLARQLSPEEQDRLLNQSLQEIGRAFGKEP